MYLHLRMHIIYIDIYNLMFYVCLHVWNLYLCCQQVLSPVSADVWPLWHRDSWSKGGTSSFSSGCFWWSSSVEPWANWFNAVLKCHWNTRPMLNMLALQSWNRHSSIDPFADWFSVCVVIQPASGKVKLELLWPLRAEHGGWLALAMGSPKGWFSWIDS